MDRLTSARARAVCTLALFVALPVLGYVDRGVTIADGAPGLTLSLGAVLAYMLAVGPAGAPLAALALLLSTVLAPGGAVTMPVVVALAVQIGAVLVAGLVLEARQRRHDGVRTPAMVAEFVLIGAVMLPLVYNGITVAAQLSTDLWHNVLADGLGVLLLPGLFVFARRDRLTVSRRDRLLLVGAGVLAVGVLVPTLLRGGPLGAGEAQIVMLPMLLVAARVGTAVYAAGMTFVALAIVTPLAVVGPTNLDVSLGGHASWWMVAAGGLLIAAEGDRSKRLTEEYQALFTYGATPTAEVHPSTGRIQRANDALAAITGWSPQELAGSVMGDLIVAQDDDHEGYPSMLTGERDELHGYAQLRRRDGELRSVRILARRVSGAGARPDRLLVQLDDLTAQEAREDALRRSNESLEQFGRRVAHDLKQPLAAVAGYAATLREHAGKLSPDVVDTMHERLDASARRAVQQLDEMFDSAAAHQAASSSVDLAEIVASVMGLVDIELAECGGAVETALAVPRVQTDGVAVQQVLLNLITNSLKYREADRPPRIRVASRIRGAGVEIAVTDNGTGIPAARIDDVFVAGARLAPTSAPGRGMGLADSRAIIEGAGGWLQAEPWVGGSRFVIWLPDPSASNTPVPIRVLIVDDDVDHRNVVALRLQLEERLDVVGEVGTISAAVATTAALRPDVVLLDRWLPDGDGLDAIGALGAAYPEVRVVVLTSDGSPGLDDRARAGGVLRTITKGRPGDELVRELVGAAG